MLSKLLSAAIIGIDAYPVEIEVDISKGLPAYIMVGLPDAAVKESKGRIEAAIKNSGIDFPFERLTINLAPADTKKEGSAFDLPIAVGILHASGIINNDSLKRYIICGELSLDGLVKPVKGALPVAAFAESIGIDGIIIPAQNAEEAAIVTGINVYPVESLPQVIEFLNGNMDIPPKKVDIKNIFNTSRRYDIDFSDVKGQYHVKRAMEVAAAGGHNVVMIGPPGSGKSMIAKRLSTILPDMTLKEAIETTRIHSIIGLIKKDLSLVVERPFRSPHHTISDAGLIGGGHHPTPGEVSISHNGVLFLDELPEFRRNVLEVMRQPLEDGVVTISRASSSLSFPARFMFVAATNPCPCGYFEHPTKACICSALQIKRYMGKLSGPLMDRIDIHIEVPPVDFNKISKGEGGESSAVIKGRVTNARNMQLERLKGDGIFSNAQMGAKQIKKYCKLEDDSNILLSSAITKMGLSARAHDRIIKVARTIADLDSKDIIHSDHISEAIQYRVLDRQM